MDRKPVELAYEANRLAALLTAYNEIDGNVDSELDKALLSLLLKLIAKMERDI